MEQILEKNSIISQNNDSNIYDFINAEKADVLETSTESNINLVNSEENVNDTISQSVNEEPIYQDILGSGDLMKKIIKQGTPDERPMKGEQIVINLVGRLEEKDVIIEEEKNLEITLGDCEVCYLKMYNKYLIIILLCFVLYSR